MQIQLYSPTPLQRQVHEKIDDPYYKIVTVVSGRQAGKTTLLINAALKFAFESKDVTIMVISPSEQQALKIYKDTLKCLEGTNVIKHKQGSKGVIQITLFTGSVIHYKSALATDSLRGNSVHYLFIDEAAFIQEDVFNEIILPMTSTVGRKIVLLSTPRGRKNILYKYYQQGKPEQLNNAVRRKTYYSFKFTYLDNPLANRELIEIFKQSMSEQSFRQEFMADFIDSGAVFKDVNKWCTRPKCKIGKYLEENKKKLVGDCVIGVDIGLKNDRTVISVMSLEGDYQIDLRSHRYASSNYIKEAIKEAIDQYHPKKCLIEVNGIGLPIYQDLADIPEYKNIVEEFYTTNQNKDEMVNNLVYLSNKDKITLCNDEDLKTELEAFSFEFLPSGKVRYAAIGAAKDDNVMATLISIEAKNRYKNSGQYLIM